MANARETLERKLKNQPELGFLLFSNIAPLHQDLKKALEYAENGLFSTLEHKEILENWGVVWRYTVLEYGYLSGNIPKVVEKHNRKITNKRKEGKKDYVSSFQICTKSQQ